NEDLAKTAETLTLKSSFDFLVSRHLGAQRSEAKSGGSTKISKLPNTNATYQAYNTKKTILNEVWPFAVNRPLAEREENPKGQTSSTTYKAQCVSGTPAQIR
ncbi:hypothetical protein IJT10_01930, partial [bacterium]|nr:hypothetical protein [bacterium]